MLQPLLRPLRPGRHRLEPAIYHKADLGPQPYHWGLFPTATFCARLVLHCRSWVPRAVASDSRSSYPTGRLYLFRFAPRATFRPSAPRTRASTLSTSGVPPYRQLRCQVWLPRCRWDELYAPGAALSTPCVHAPPIHRHTVASRTRAQGNHRSITRRGSGRAGAIRNSLRTASHSHLTVFDNALYRETI